MPWAADTDRASQYDPPMPADDAKFEGKELSRIGDTPRVNWASRQVNVFVTQLGQFRYLAADLRKVGRWVANKVSGRRAA